MAAIGSSGNAHHVIRDAVSASAPRSVHTDSRGLRHAAIYGQPPSETPRNPAHRVMWSTRATFDRCERFIRTLKGENVSLHECEGFHDADARIGEFLIDVYTRKRIHSALDYLTPEEFEIQCLMSPPGIVGALCLK
jgi:transposase InsO family protein